MLKKIIINSKNGIEEYLKEQEPFLFETDNDKIEGLIQRNIILAGFPGIGKSYAGKIYDNCIDFESSEWHWSYTSRDKKPSRFWPSNYVESIATNALSTFIKHNNKSNYILISTHKEVLSLLKKYNLIFYIVAPQSKDNAIRRYIDRGSSQSFIDSITKNWDAYMNDLVSYDVPVIYTDSYLSDLICSK